MYIYMHGLKEDTLFEFIRTCSIRSISPISRELIRCHIWYFAGLAAKHEKMIIGIIGASKFPGIVMKLGVSKKPWLQLRNLVGLKLGSGNSNIFCWKFSPLIFVVQISTQFDVRICFSDRLVGQFNHQPAASDADFRSQAYSKRAKTRLKNAAETFLWVKLVMVFF